MSNGKKKLSGLLITGLVCAGIAYADTYKNNVVDVRVNNENGNAVKVIIYTDRPYTDPVVVNKKANNKYVILMPETNSLLKSTPTVTNGSGTISNVSVNTQSVSGGKGYTKITITSEKAINVVPRTQQIVSKVKPTPTTKTTTLSTTKPVTTPTTATKPQPTNAQKVAQEKAKQDAIKKAAAEKAKQEQAKKLAQQKAAQQKAQQAAKPKPQPIEVLEKEIKTGQYANVTQDKDDTVLNNEIKENLENKPAKKDNIPVVEQKNKSVAENIKSVLKDYKNISIWKLLLLAGAVTFPILVIMVILGMDKKINKKIDASFKREEDYMQEYIPKDVPPVAPTEPAEEQDTFNSFDEMLDQVNEPEVSFQEQISNTEETEPETPQYEFNNDYAVDDFEPEPVDIATPVQEIIQEVQEVQQVQEPVQPEPAIEPPAPVQEVEVEPYNPDGYLADFAGISDNDFFDELAMQTMASNNADNGLPQQSPADEVFNFMNEEEEQPAQEVEPVQKAEPTPSVEPVLSTETPSEETQEPQEPTSAQDDDGLTMLTEVKLNDTTGIYLVNYDNFSSLVGHINDDYFVIKKFDELVTGQIFYKEAEKLKDSKRYLVRVGKNKMVVEVTPTSMTRLIDL